MPDFPSISLVFVNSRTRSTRYLRISIPLIEMRSSRWCSLYHNTTQKTSTTFLQRYLWFYEMICCLATDVECIS